MKLNEKEQYQAVLLLSPNQNLIQNNINNINDNNESGIMNKIKNKKIMQKKTFIKKMKMKYLFPLKSKKENIKHIFWHKNSQKKRKGIVSRLKSNIKREMKGISHLFHTIHLIVPENPTQKTLNKIKRSLGDNHHAYDLNEFKTCHWLDCYFVSKKNNNDFYNCTIECLRPIIEDYYFDLIANNQKHGLHIHNDIDFSTWKTMNFQERLDATFTPFYQEYSSGKVIINKEYAYGIGLDVFIPKMKQLTIKDIEQFINDFYNNNEQDNTILRNDQNQQIPNYQINETEIKQYINDFHQKYMEKNKIHMI